MRNVLIALFALALSLGSSAPAFAFPDDPGYCGSVPTC